jgi:hypothetical protein
MPLRVGPRARRSLTSPHSSISVLMNMSGTAPEMGTKAQGMSNCAAPVVVNQNTSTPSNDSQQKLNRWLKKTQTCKNSKSDQATVEESKGPQTGPPSITTSKEQDKGKESAINGSAVKNDTETASFDASVASAVIEGKEKAHTGANLLNSLADPDIPSHTTKQLQSASSVQLGADRPEGRGSPLHAADITATNVNPHTESPGSSNRQTSAVNQLPPSRTEASPAPAETLPTGPPRRWSVSQVRAWLLGLGLAPAVAARFEEEEIGGEALLVLRAPELVELGVSALGPRTVLLSRIRELKAGRNGCREDLPAADAMAGVDVASWLAGHGVAEGVVRR